MNFLGIVFAAVLFCQTATATLLIKSPTADHLEFQKYLLLHPESQKFSAFYLAKQAAADHSSDSLETCIGELNRSREDRIEECAMALVELEKIFLSPGRLAIAKELLLKLKKHSLVYSDLLKRYTSWHVASEDNPTKAPFPANWTPNKMVYINGLSTTEIHPIPGINYQFAFLSEDFDPVIVFGNLEGLSNKHNMTSESLISEGSSQTQLLKESGQYQVFIDQEKIESYGARDPFQNVASARYAENSRWLKQESWVWIGILTIAAASYALRDQRMVVSPPH